MRERGREIERGRERERVKEPTMISHQTMVNHGMVEAFLVPLLAAPVLPELRYPLFLRGSPKKTSTGQGGPNLSLALFFWVLNITTQEAADVFCLYSGDQKVMESPLRLNPNTNPFLFAQPEIRMTCWGLVRRTLLRTSG